MAKKVTTLDFIKKAQQVHGNLYNYSETVYEKAKKKVRIICKLHGIFEQTPDAHVRGQGCPVCGRKIQDDQRRKDSEYFISKSVKVHGDKYDYSKSVYTGVYNKIEIICKYHNKSFWQVANKHYSGQGCPFCQADNFQFKKSNTEDFINKVRKRFPEWSYLYNKVDYQGVYTKIIVGCQIHGSFEVIPDKHLQGQGCPSCSLSGYKRNLPGQLYITRWEGQGKDFIKVGISNKQYNKRISSQSNNCQYSHETIAVFQSEDGGYIADIEKEILSKFDFPYCTKQEFEDGFTETTCVTNFEEILNLLKGKLNDNSREAGLHQVILT